jgi:hypothetical protein
VKTTAHKSSKPRPQLAPGYAWCPRCECSRREADFAKNKRLPSGRSVYCKFCSNSWGRFHYHEQQERLALQSCAAHVPPELLAKFEPAPGARIGCLRCRHARLLPTTDFTAPEPRLRCAKQGCAVALTSRCEIADPRPAKPRALQKYCKKYGPLGDKLTHAGGVLLAYLKARWTEEIAATLEEYSGYTMAKLASIVRYHKIGGIRVGKHRLHHMKPQPEKYFTPEQTEYLLAAYCSARWPRPLIWNLAETERKARLLERRRIVDAVARRGPRWNWRQIQRHVIKQMKARRERGVKARRGEQRKVNQFVSIAREKN